MKKKILLGACAALFLGAGITTARISMRTSNESELLLANLEALAEEENIGGTCNWIVIYYSEDRKECPSRTGSMCCTF